MFYIQARNHLNQNRESGADEFVVNIIRPDMVVLLEQERARLAEERARLEEENKKGPTKKGEEE